MAHKQLNGGDLTQQIERLLRELHFHPDFEDERQQHLDELAAEFGKTHKGGAREVFTLRDQGDPEANRIWQVGYELSLSRDYYPARVRFLEELVPSIRGSPNTRPRVADDGCGAGVDLYCLRHILGDQVELIGVEPNRFAQGLCGERNPGIELMENLEGGQPSDIVYCDFVSWGRNNMGVSDILDKRGEWHRALNSGGLLIQNVDFPDWQRGIYEDLVSRTFNLERDELIQDVADNHNCHLIMFKKK